MNTSKPLVITQDFLWHHIKRLNCDQSLKYQISTYLADLSGETEKVPNLIPKFLDLILSCNGYIDIISSDVSQTFISFTCVLRAWVGLESLHLEPIGKFDEDDCDFFISDVYTEMLNHFNPTGNESPDDLHFAVSMFEQLVVNVIGSFLIADLTNQPKSFHVQIISDDINNILTLVKVA